MRKELNVDIMNLLSFHFFKDDELAFNEVIKIANSPELTNH